MEARPLPVLKHLGVLPRGSLGEGLIDYMYMYMYIHMCVREIDRENIIQTHNMSMNHIYIHTYLEIPQLLCRKGEQGVD